MARVNKQARTETIMPAWNTHDFPTVPTWHNDRIVIIGDAAHTVHPLAGQGLNLGLADANELARVLHQREYWRGVCDAKLLRRYERSRKADVLAMGAATDGLQQLFAQQAEPWASLRNRGLAASMLAKGSEPRDTPSPQSTYRAEGWLSATRAIAVRKVA